MDLHYWRARVNNSGCVAYIDSEYLIRGFIANNGAYTLYYSDDYVVGNDFTITLAEPSTLLTFSSTNYDTTLPIIAGKYFSTRYTSNSSLSGTSPVSAGAVYKASDTISAWYSGGSTRTISISSAASLSTRWVEDSYNWYLVTSNNINTYPVNGFIGNIEYQYIGTPKDNSIQGAKIQYGSYMGNGTCGVDNPITLTFDFVPKILMLHIGSRPYIASMYSGPYPVIGHPYLLTTEYQAGLFIKASYDSSGNSYVMAKRSEDGRIINWYDDTDYVRQYNTNRTRYYYIAIG